ncbi:MAG TPA: hypothetical protein VF945_00710 [Polyangia bacterium]
MASRLRIGVSACLASFAPGSVAAALLLVPYPVLVTLAGALNLRIGSLDR